jgi:hypothetical protein
MNDELLTSLTEVIEQPPALPEAELNVEAPADAPAQARDESGKFAPKDEKPKDEPKAEAPKEQPKPEPKQEQRTIPLAAHLEERRALKAELDAMKAQLAALQNPPKAPAPEPDYAADPKAYTDHKVQTALEKLSALEQKQTTVEQTTQQVAQQTETQQFLQAVSTAEADFVKQQPDYFDAVNHIRQVRLQQLQIFNPDMPQEQMYAMIRNEEIGMAMQLAKAGRNPVHAAYALAKAHGYQPKQQQQQAPALELPKVPSPKQLPPDQTLGSSAGDATDIQDDKADPFEQAFGEMFKRKSA